MTRRTLGQAGQADAASVTTGTFCKTGRSRLLPPSGFSSNVGEFIRCSTPNVQENVIYKYQNPGAADEDGEEELVAGFSM